MTDEEKRIVAVLRQWEDSLVLFGKGHQRCVRDLGKAANMIEKLSAERDAWKSCADAAKRDLGGIIPCISCKKRPMGEAPVCDICEANHENWHMKNYAWRGPCVENGGVK